MISRDIFVAASVAAQGVCMMREIHDVLHTDLNKFFTQDYHWEISEHHGMQVLDDTLLVSVSVADEVISLYE